MTQRTDVRTIKVKDLKEGMWIAFADPRFDCRVVDVQCAKHNDMRIETDYGNGGIPTVEFYPLDNQIWVQA